MANIDLITAQISEINDQKELKLVSDYVRAQWDLLGRRAARLFRIGDKVEFNTRRGSVVTGTVESVNPKTVSVRDNLTGGRWKVTASLLRRAA